MADQEDFDYGDEKHDKGSDEDDYEEDDYEEEDESEEEENDDDEEEDPTWQENLDGRSKGESSSDDSESLDQEDEEDEEGREKEEDSADELLDDEDLDIEDETSASGGGSEDSFDLTDSEETRRSASKKSINQKGEPIEKRDSPSVSSKKVSIHKSKGEKIELEKKEEASSIKPKKGKKPSKKNRELDSDEEKEGQNKNFGVTDFHHYINFFVHDSGGIYSSSNQTYNSQSMVLIRQHGFLVCSENVIRTMMLLRRKRFILPTYNPATALSSWKSFIALGSIEAQLEWILKENLGVYRQRIDFNQIGQNVSTFWWTEDQYQSFVQAIQALPPNAKELPPLPKKRSWVFFTVFNPGTNALRVWKNTALKEIKNKDKHEITDLLMVYSKSFVATDKVKKKDKKDQDVLVREAYKETLRLWQTLFYRKYHCELCILTSNQLMLFLPACKMMPEVEKIDPEEFPDGIQKMRGRPFGIMYANEPIVKLYHWKPGDYIRFTSYLDRTHPHVEIRKIHPAKTLYRKIFKDKDKKDPVSSSLFTIASRPPLQSSMM